MKQMGIAFTLVAGMVLAWPGAAVAAPAANDDFDNATTVSEPLPFTDVVPSVDATAAVDDPACDGTTPSVWYRFTPTRTGLYAATGTAEPYGANLSIFTGTRDALTMITCSSGTSGWHADEGVTYYFMVSAFSWSPPGDLSFTLDGPAIIDVTLDPEGRFDPHTGVAQISGTVTCLATGWAPISGELRQRVGRVIIYGPLAVQPPVCDGVSRPWTADVTGTNGRFAGGKASARVEIDGCLDAATCIRDVAEGTVQLTGRP